MRACDHAPTRAIMRERAVACGGASVGYRAIACFRLRESALPCVSVPRRASACAGTRANARQRMLSSPSPNSSESEQGDPDITGIESLLSQGIFTKILRSRARHVRAVLDDRDPAARASVAVGPRRTYVQSSSGVEFSHPVGRSP